MLSDEASAEVAKLPDTVRKELEEKKKAAEEKETKMTAELEEKKKLAEEHAAKEKTMAEELERLRAELKVAVPPSPEKQTLSEADAEADIDAVPVSKL